MKIIGFVCDTPLQIFNCINIACNSFGGEEYKKILYVGMIFKNSEEIVSRLKETSVFDEIYCFKEVITVIEKSVILRGRSLVTPKSVLKKFCMDDGLVSFKFDCLFVNMLNYFTRLVMFANKYNELVEYEDGIGNYIDNTFDYSVLSPLARILNKIYNGKLMPRTEKIYLNCVGGYKNKNKKQVYAIRSLNDNNIALNYIKRVFDYDDTSSLYKDNKIVFLSQVVDYDEVKTQQIEHKFLDSIISEYRDIIVRYHPRQKLEKSDKYPSDESCSMWEIECFENIDENTILINSCSTAAFMPVMLANKKPYVIFVFEYFKQFYPEYMISNIYKMFELIKEYYAEDREKIVILKPEEDIVACINAIRKG